MRPAQPELRVEIPALSKKQTPEKKNVLGKLKTGLSERVNHLREAITPEPVFRATLERAQNVSGYTVDVFIDKHQKEPKLTLTIPPLSQAAKDMTQKFRRFAYSQIPVNSGHGVLINPVSSHRKDGAYSLWLNPDYIETQNGNPSNKDDLEIQFSARSSLEEEDSLLLTEATTLLSKFASAKDEDYYILLELVEWELDKREALRSLEWSIDEGGRSEAVLRGIESLEGKAAEAKKISITLSKIEAELKVLRRSMQRYQQMREMDELPEERRSDDTNAIREVIRKRAETLEASLQELFHFLPLFQEIFSQGDLSFIDPLKISSEDLVLVSEKDMAEIEKFVLWMRKCLVDALLVEAIAEPAEKMTRFQSYLALTPPQKESDKPRLTEAWGELEESVVALHDVQRVFPNVELSQILIAYSGLLALHRLRLSQNWTTWDTPYRVRTFSQAVPVIAQRESGLVSFMLKVSEEIVPTVEDLASVDRQHVSYLKQELLQILGEDNSFVKLLSNIDEFIDIAEVLSQTGYQDYSDELKNALNIAVVNTKPALSTLIHTFREDKSDAQEIPVAEKSLTLILSAVELVADLQERISSYLQSPPAQS